MWTSGLHEAFGNYHAIFRSGLLDSNIFASSEIISKKSGRSMELWVYKELDYDEGKRLKTNSLERRMVVMYCCHIFLLWYMYQV